MHWNDNMKKYILVILVIIGLVGGLYLARQTSGHKLKKGTLKIECKVNPQELNKSKAASLEEGIMLLKSRRDKEALAALEKVLAQEPENLEALWGKAEILCRYRKYHESEIILNEILKKNPLHIPSMLTLSYIKYKQGNLKESWDLVEHVLKIKGLDKDDEALAYMMTGAINSRNISSGNLIGKIIHGLQVKASFCKAVKLAPHLPEVHLALGTFYLMAPGILGGGVNNAIRELDIAVRIAPDFAMANARLAYAYKKKGRMSEYNFYIRRARELDPENEAIAEQ